MRRQPASGRTPALTMTGAATPGLTASLARPSDPPPRESEPHRLPITLALASEGTRLLTANQTADSASLVDAESGRVLHEVAASAR
ncbi:MAG TPA: hypothetical protein VKP69_19765 [Isosphaeraceae bacterium]|nr:hypothetical protein [Isosphaeraceae bacterium]